MNLHNVTRNLNLLLRTEKILAKTQMRLSARKMALAVGAGISLLFTIGMLNAAVYFLLEPVVNRAFAALLVAIGDLIIAALMLWTAGTLKAAPEEEMVKEVRDMAFLEIEAEAASVQEQLVQIQGDIRGMRETLVGFTRHPINSLTSGALVPAVSILAKAMHSYKSSQST